MSGNMIKDLLIKTGLVEVIKKGQLAGRQYQKIRLGPLAYVLMLSALISGIVFWDVQHAYQELNQQAQLQETQSEQDPAMI